MKPFAGFPARMDFTPVPNLFLSQIMPEISDINELKTTLHIMAEVYRKKGNLRFVTFSELSANTSLIKSIESAGKPAEETLRSALETAIKRGVILRLAAELDGGAEDIYFVNTEADRQAVAKIETGELKLPGLKAIKSPPETEELPDIFTLYEENIGMLTPMIAEELKEAEKLYPETWIRDAMKEAASLNKRSIRYIVRILENWAQEGRGNGAHKRFPGKEDPDKYIKGRYGHMVRRR
jgi:DnaD/phage-associated family protein